MVKNTKVPDSRDTLLDNPITTPVQPLPALKAAVHKTGQDTDVGLVAATPAKKPEQDDFADKATPEEISALELFMLQHLTDQNDLLSFQRTAAEEAQIQEALDYYKNDIDADNAQALEQRIARGESGDYDSSGITYIPGGRGGHGTLRFGDMGRIPVGEKQTRVNDVINDAAAAAGVNLNTMRGIWHVESKFSTLREVSPTGCSGAFQFTQGTWAQEMIQHGDEIAARLNARGFKDDAAIALRYTQALRSKSISIYDEGLQSQRFNGHIATYASAFYISDIARRNGIDAMNANEGGKLYAAYNVGEGSLRTLMRNQGNGASAMGLLGRVAALNPMFYQGGATAADALANYQAAMNNGARQYANAFGSGPALAARPEPHSFVAGAFGRSSNGAPPQHGTPAHTRAEPTILASATDMLSRATHALEAYVPKFWG